MWHNWQANNTIMIFYWEVSQGTFHCDDFSSLWNEPKSSCVHVISSLLIVQVYKIPIQILNSEQRINRSKYFFNSDLRYILEFDYNLQGSLVREARLLILLFHDTHFCQIIWQIFTQGRAKKNCQKLSPIGIEPMTSGSSCQCSTNWAKSTFSCQPESSSPL